ncbi:unnamed protein product [Acanthocheilonema viteae]|uniref:RING-type domain-containing protein n=1 Tax=Acanthocheilonema viteae TaxID=6277 RepID=A0A498SR87_ACAVI|nr:unnamed protein product [Acanthocheilonema viteae]
MKKLELINVKKEIACFVCSRNLHLTNIAALRCGHTFHPQCISPLVKIDKKCPMCKKEAEEDSIIPRLFVEIKEKDDDSSNINDTEEREMSTEILDALDEMEVQIRLIYVQIKHNIALMEMLKKRIESCFEIWRWTL